MSDGIDARLRCRLLEDVRSRLFTPLDDRGGERVGVEVEVIPRDRRLGRTMPIVADGAGPGSLQLLRGHGEPRGWTVCPGPHGAPMLRLPAGGTIAFEPGGQVEYATPPMRSVGELMARLDAVVPPLLVGARRRDIELICLGIDPRTPLEAARLRLRGERYRAMHDYLARFGDAGPRMMLQTAAMQVNIELGPAPELRWRALNGAAPYLTAIFANSRIYEGEDSGFASFRARQWRRLDRRRTGLLGREPDMIAEYVDFALEAGWIFAPAGREPEPFGRWLARGEASLEDWRRHCTTLFPEIRSRGFLEIRCIDALPPEWYAAPVVVIAGMVADERSLGETLEVVGAPDSQRLMDAARDGIHDAAIGGVATQLFRLALDSAERIGLPAPAIDTARRYFDAYTARRRAPADDEVDRAA